MVTIEKLNSKNINEFYSLLSDANENIPYREDFHKFYDNKSFIYKFIIKKLVKIFKVNGESVGYIWYEPPCENLVKINDMYIKEEYISYFDKNLFLIFKSNLVSFDCFENYYSTNLLKKLNFRRIRPTYLLKLTDNNIKDSCPDGISFSIYNPEKDAPVRCIIQNSIFKEENRIPLSVEDIHYDEKQDYYIKDLCIFIRYKNIPVGYGQIIFSRGIFTIANFGIEESYRFKGFGKILMEKLIKESKRKNIKNLYIRVDSNNIPAINLYKKVGFQKIGHFTNWIWSKKLN